MFEPRDRALFSATSLMLQNINQFEKNINMFKPRNSTVFSDFAAALDYKAMLKVQSARGCYLTIILLLWLQIVVFIV